MQFDVIYITCGIFPIGSFSLLMNLYGFKKDIRAVKSALISFIIQTFLFIVIYFYEFDHWKKTLRFFDYVIYYFLTTVYSYYLAKDIKYMVKYRSSSYLKNDYFLVMGGLITDFFYLYWRDAFYSSKKFE